MCRGKYEKSKKLNYHVLSAEPLLMLQQMHLISISLKRNGTSDSKLKLFVTLKKFLSPSSVTKINKSTMLISNLFKKVRKTKITLIAESNNWIGLIRNRNAWQKCEVRKCVINISKHKKHWSQPLLLSFASIRWSPFEFSNAVLCDTKRAHDKWDLKYALHAICHDYY